MKEKKIGGLDVSSTAKLKGNSFIIATFALDGCGKTKLAMSGPGPVGFVPLETKAFPTIVKDGDEQGVEVVRPKDPMALLVSPRKINMMVGNKESSRDAQQQQFFYNHVAKIEEYVYALMEDEEIRLVCMDKFNTYCTWVELAINGMNEKFMKVQGQVYKDRREVNQHIIDFLNSLGQYGKPVILNNASKADYDGPLDHEKKPTRNTWDGFKYLGSHANLVVELVDNKLWDPEKNGDKHNWKYGLNVRRSQTRPELEGPEGQMVLKDDAITLPKLMKKVDPDNFDPEAWM